MPLCSTSLRLRIQSWLRDYDRLQSVAVILIYIQIGCALIGSLGALYNGVLLINLVVALFALVAIESSSQSLGRTYAVLLFFAIVLDIAWFILFSRTIWNVTPDQKYGQLFVFSLRLALLMEIVGFSVRFLSTFLWIQIYRLGVSTVDNPINHADYSVRNSFVNPSTHDVARQNSNSDEILGGAIYDPTYYSSLFEDAQDKRCMPEGDKQIVHDGLSSPVIEAPKLKSCIGRSFHGIDIDSALRKPLVQ
ncbi:uncharacterized protein LOC135634674 [Musa acuminata AAA Group]|uniref:(wild Malaysian banana) hypothetical protein n=1 Tax=Musa acuminata subsp. malaccensis TaxID=214687 RepID=A0A804IN56_MUSAM|nr:PREDICTED: uncharacterized protein LOC103981089 [Musa acuminata subsp. malaccensis]CAG1841749.1 unnamed protein product [Musa acuminata subsp. malaccensis]